nr:hypothetical protein [Microcystis aeruginosa]
MCSLYSTDLVLYHWGYSRLKSGVTFGFIAQSKLLGGRTPTPPRISFSVGCLQAAADIFVII